MTKKRGAGQKTKYEKLDIANRLPEIEQMCRDGFRDVDVAKALGINKATIYNWQRKYPEFAEAMSKGKAYVDAEIENSLIDNAMGGMFWEETQELRKVKNPETGRMEEKLVTVKRVLKQVKPDTTAQIFWLKNRLPHKWRDRQQIEHSGAVGTYELDYLSDEELEKELKQLGVDLNE